MNDHWSGILQHHDFISRQLAGCLIKRQSWSTLARRISCCLRLCRKFLFRHAGWGTVLSLEQSCRQQCVPHQLDCDIWLQYSKHRCCSPLPETPHKLPHSRVHSCEPTHLLLGWLCGAVYKITLPQHLLPWAVFWNVSRVELLCNIAREGAMQWGGWNMKATRCESEPTKSKWQPHPYTTSYSSWQLIFHHSNAAFRPQKSTTEKQPFWQTRWQLPKQ